MKIILILISLFHFQLQAQDIIQGCEGEGCECFTEYQKNKPNAFVPTIRSFKVYSKPNKSSKIVGDFKEGTKAQLLKQILLVNERGSYKVKSTAQDKKINLKKDDLVHTLRNEGEGFSSVIKSNGQQVDFYFEDVELETIKETDLESWIQLKVHRKTGFTQDKPFEYCLE